MLQCEQTKGQSVWQHGLSVWEHYQELSDYLKDDGYLPNWKIPSWVVKFKFNLLANAHNDSIIREYLLMHDCGKPFCKTVDEEGNIHFPNHAEVSKEVYKEINNDPTIYNLIGWDMVIHTASADEIKHYCENVWSVQDAVTLLLASLSEIHSNSRLFGGIDSISFKSKWKKVERRGNQICKFYFGG